MRRLAFAVCQDGTSHGCALYVPISIGVSEIGLKFAGLCLFSETP